MNGIIGASRILEGIEGSPETMELIGMIRSSGDGLLRVVNDVLDFSKVEAGKLELEAAPFHLPGALKESIGLFRTAAESKGLRLVDVLDHELPDWVSGDRIRLRQVAMNLISNALKFTHSGEVVLSACVEWRDQTSICIAVEVRDTGMGIAPDQLLRLFESFQQADASISRRFGGTGLGLAISKRLVELMGGTINAESAPGEGTRFRFTVRMEQAVEPAASQSPLQPAECATVGWTNTAHQRPTFRCERGLPFSSRLLEKTGGPVRTRRQKALEFIAAELRQFAHKQARKERFFSKSHGPEPSRQIH